MQDSDLKRTVDISMPYIGGVLSVNRYKYKGGLYTKREVKQWMDALAMVANNKLRKERVKVPVIIHINGLFKDKRVPDLANLHKVIGDALETALDINDKHFRFVDEGYSIHKRFQPEIIIGIEVE